ncbi:hypothetical protein RHS01_10635 [Rhizoctonia solani]|uniref:Uncharacterized protein n=1 Tax=Rhizoctonia solani TaxID=456999 RepID=A0A8H7M0C4_9AGAM|nr:hypothetical protein RHS01_10635 [Rhizoctonia solani]
MWKDSKSYTINTIMSNCACARVSSMHYYMFPTMFSAAGLSGGIGPGCSNAIAKRSLLVQNPRSFHGLGLPAMLFGKSSTPVNVTQMEEIKPGYKERILRFPCLCKYFLKPNLRWRIAQYFYTNFPVCSFHEWLKFIPERCKRWGKVCIQNAEDTGPGDCIQSAVATNPFSPYGKRNASFVKYTFQRDKNKRSRRKEPEMGDVNAYGQLDFILAITLPAEAQKVMQASKMIAFTKFGRLIILDISLVMNLAGRVFTRGVVATGEWIIINQGKAIQQTAFDIPKEARKKRWMI